MNETDVLDPNAATAETAAAETTTNQGSKSSGSTESWSRSWVKTDGVLDHSAFEKAPDEFKSLSKDLSRYKTFDDFLKGHNELKALVGKKGIVDPLPKDATPEMQAERQALLRKVNGAPDKPEGYALIRPKEIPEDRWDQNYANTIAGIAHKHGIPPAALHELAKAEVDYTQAAFAANAKAEADWFEKQDGLIRSELEKIGLDYAKGKDLAERAGKKWGIDAANPLMKNASVFMLLTRLAKADSEDVLVRGELDGLGLAKDIGPEEAQKQAIDMLRNKDNPDHLALTDRGHAEHAKAVSKYETLMKVVSQKRTRR